MRYYYYYYYYYCCYGNVRADSVLGVRTRLELVVRKRRPSNDAET